MACKQGETANLFLSGRHHTTQAHRQRAREQDSKAAWRGGLSSGDLDRYDWRAREGSVVFGRLLPGDSRFGLGGMRHARHETELNGGTASDGQVGGDTMRY